MAAGHQLVTPGRLALMLFDLMIDRGRVDVVGVGDSVEDEAIYALSSSLSYHCIFLTSISLLSQPPRPSRSKTLRPKAILPISTSPAVNLVNDLTDLEEMTLFFLQQCQEVACHLSTR